MHIIGRAAIVFATAIGGTALVPAVAGAHGRDGNDRAAPTSRPVQWTIDAASCGELPPGTVLVGDGTLTSRTKERIRNGIMTRRVVEHADGTARDQQGNTYHWAYDNELQVRNSAATPMLFSGVMVDTFVLSGGPASIDNGFEGTYVEDNSAGTFGIYPTSVSGDPFTFPSGPGRCDPI